MTLVEEILTELWESEYVYKGVRVNIFGIPKFTTKRPSVQRSLSRLKHQGFVSNDMKAVWKLTSKGKEFLKSKNELPHFLSPFPKNASKDLIVMFDIPEKRREWRNWLRGELKSLDYAQLQQSVWVGPSPLPKQFVKLWDEFDLKDCIETFKLKGGYKKKK